MTNSIKLSEIQEKLRKACDAGYGDTIELKINGEHYSVINDKKKVRV